MLACWNQAPTIWDRIPDGSIDEASGQGQNGSLCLTSSTRTLCWFGMALMQLAFLIFLIKSYWAGGRSGGRPTLRGGGGFNQEFSLGV